MLGCGGADQAASGGSSRAAPIAGSAKLKLAVRGAEPSRKVQSAELLLRMLARLTSASGYVHEWLSAPDVQVISVDQQMPGNPGYPIVYSG
jgi:hypothetical protein